MAITLCFGSVYFQTQNTDLGSRSLPALIPKSLELTYSLGVNLERSSCSYSISACNSDCLMITLSFKIFPLRVKTATNWVVPVLVNPWGDHCALPFTVWQEVLSLRFPLASENSLYRTCMVIPIVTTAWSWSLAWCLCFCWVQKIATVSQLQERSNKSKFFFFPPVWSPLALLD